MLGRYRLGQVRIVRRAAVEHGAGIGLAKQAVAGDIDHRIAFVDQDRAATDDLVRAGGASMCTMPAPVSMLLPLPIMSISTGLRTCPVMTTWCPPSVRRMAMASAVGDHEYRAVDRDFQQAVVGRDLHAFAARPNLWRGAIEHQQLVLGARRR